MRIVSARHLKNFESYINRNTRFWTMMCSVNNMDWNETIFELNFGSRSNQTKSILIKSCGFKKDKYVLWMNCEFVNRKFIGRAVHSVVIYGRPQVVIYERPQVVIYERPPTPIFIEETCQRCVIEFKETSTLFISRVVIQNAIVVVKY